MRLRAGQRPGCTAAAACAAGSADSLLESHLLQKRTPPQIAVERAAFGRGGHACRPPRGPAPGDGALPKPAAGRFGTATLGAAIAQGEASGRDDHASRERATLDLAREKTLLVQDHDSPGLSTPFSLDAIEVDPRCETRVAIEPHRMRSGRHPEPVPASTMSRCVSLLMSATAMPSP